MAAGICRAPRKYGVCADNLLNVLKPIQIDCGGGFLAFFLNHEKEFQIDYAITYHFTGRGVEKRDVKRYWTSGLKKLSRAENNLLWHKVPFVYYLVGPSGDVIQGAYPKEAGDMLFASKGWQLYVKDKYLTAPLPISYIEGARDPVSHRKRAAATGARPRNLTATLDNDGDGDKRRKV